MITRALDLLIAGVALVVSSPVMLVATVAIRVESHGSPIYRQRRIGRDGEPFEMLKLRTMVSGAEHKGAGMAVNYGDPRITRVGRILRRFSIDELPNLVNVLRGEMSVVGPRPTIQAQINGRASLPWHERIELDVWYVDHRTLRLDMAILWKTVRLLVTGEGLYKGDKGGWKSTT